MNKYILPSVALIIALIVLGVVGYGQVRNANIIVHSMTQDGVEMITVISGAGVYGLSDTEQIKIKRTIRNTFAQTMYEQRERADNTLQQEFSDINVHTLTTWVENWTCDASGCTPTELRSK